VTDEAALAFATAFYQALAARRPIGEAVAEARRPCGNATPTTPTWLAYRCFADPLARVTAPPPPSVRPVPPKPA